MGARVALRRRREELDLSQERVAQEVGVSTTTYRAWEAGTSTPRVGRRRQLGDVLEWPAARVAEALDDAPLINGHAVPRWLGIFASFEQGAAQIRTFQPLVVHGLLQTAEYAAAVEGIYGDSDDRIGEKVRSKLARQAVLSRDGDPLRLWAILDESILYRVAGTREVMAAQLDHLVVVGERENVTVQVMPPSAAVFPAAFGAFTLFTSPGEDSPYMGVVADVTGPHYLDRPSLIDAHIELFEHLSATALSPADTAERIRNICKEHYR